MQDFYAASTTTFHVTMAGHYNSDLLTTLNGVQNYTFQLHPTKIVSMIRPRLINPHRIPVPIKKHQPKLKQELSARNQLSTVLLQLPISSNVCLENLNSSPTVTISLQNFQSI